MNDNDFEQRAVCILFLTLVKGVLLFCSGANDNYFSRENRRSNGTTRNIADSSDTRSFMATPDQRIHLLGNIYLRANTTITTTENFLDLKRASQATVSKSRSLTNLKVTLTAPIDGPPNPSSAITEATTGTTTNSFTSIFGDDGNDDGDNDDEDYEFFLPRRRRTLSIGRIGTRGGIEAMSNRRLQKIDEFRGKTTSVLPPYLRCDVVGRQGGRDLCNPLYDFILRHSALPFIYLQRVAVIGNQDQR